MKIHLQQKNKAFTLIETLVAISIFTMSILGLMSILASGISNTNYAKRKITATYLAQEGIEHVRNFRDTDVISAVDGQTGWNNFKTKICTSNNPITDYSINGSDFPGFTRTISTNLTCQPTISITDEVKISSTVIWTQGSGNYTITFSEDLFNWVE